MVEATTQLNYTLNTKVTAGTTGNVASGVIVSSSGSNTNTTEAPNDFNLIAANCNTNVCFFCQKTFTNVYNCRRHIRTHSGEKPFQCNVCGKKFSRQSTLNAHEKVHTGDQLFKCEVCGQAFDVYRHLTEHMAAHRIDKPFTCKICNKSYSRATVLTQHMKTHSTQYNEQMSNVGPIIVTTPAQTMQAPPLPPPPAPVITQTTVVVSPQEKALPPMPIITIPAPIVISQPMHKCQHCDKVFTSINDLKDHELYHVVIQQEEKKIVALKDVVVVVKQQEEPQIIQLAPQIKCYICSESFNTEQECANHVLVHNRIQLQNNVQPHVTQVAVQPPKVHIVETPDEGIDDEMKEEDETIPSYHHVEQMQVVDKVPFAVGNDIGKCSCNVCGKRFNDDNEMRMHTKSHLCEKFKCDVCDKRFSILSNFNVHKGIHKRDKPFRCDVCGKSFRLAKSLTVHMVLHTESESFNCPVCDRSFNRSGSLKIHMKSHTTAELQAPKRAYIDVMCHDADDDLFGDDDENNRDMMFDFVDERPTYCDICGKKFTRVNGMTRTHKCSKYPTNDDEDYEDEDDQLSSLDIWNCD